MTTKTWVSFLDHSTTAAFRLWGSEIGVNMALVGMVQTSDTGQINWSTVTLPAINTIAGYEIWRFADSSLYLKIQYGTDSTLGYPRMFIQVGTGSNGSGTLTGQLSTANALFTNAAAPVSTTTNYISAVCHTADSFSLSWKEGSTSGSGVMGLLVIGKTVDGAGAASSVGYVVLRTAVAVTGGFLKQSVRIASIAQSFTDSSKDISIPGEPTSSVVPSGNTQAYQISGNFPDVKPWPWAAVVLISEAPRGVTFSVAMVASVSHTYRSPGVLFPGGFGAQSYPGGTYTFALIWE